MEQLRTPGGAGFRSGLGSSEERVKGDGTAPAGLGSVRQTGSSFGFLCVPLGLILCFVAFNEDLS